MMQGPDGGQEIIGGIFRIQPGFQRMAGACDFRLPLGKRLTAGHFQLPFHQILAGHHLGYRMLDLKPGIHLHEEKRARHTILGGFDDKFHRAGPLVTDGQGRICRRPAHGGAQILGHAGRRGLLQDFLMAALDRTVALEQVDRLPVGVGKDLQLDMARTGHEPLDQYMVIAEGIDGLAFAAFQGGGEIGRLFHQPHALAATAKRCLDQHRITHALGLRRQEIRILLFAVIAGHQRHAGFFHDLLGLAF